MICVVDLITALHLLMNIESQEYIGALSPNVGAVLVVHDRSLLPFPSQQGMTIVPGYTTNIAITKVC